MWFYIFHWKPYVVSAGAWGPTQQWRWEAVGWLVASDACQYFAQASRDWMFIYDSLLQAEGPMPGAVAAARACQLALGDAATPTCETAPWTPGCAPPPAPTRPPPPNGQQQDYDWALPVGIGAAALLLVIAIAKRNTR
jgi:hypothetical protein